MTEDLLKPFTFIEWLDKTPSIVPDLNKQFSDYKNYILQWSQENVAGKNNYKNLVFEMYVQLLKEIVINYSTEEEKRFITNVDLSNESDIEIILPFFITKLKKLCLYYANTRESLKTVITDYNLKGTNFGVKKIVKDIILNTAQLDTFVDNVPCIFPPASAIAADLNIVIEELYDTTDNYFNKLNSDQEAYSSILQNTSAINFVFPDLYLDIKNSIIKAINQYSFNLSTIENITVNPVLSGTELGYLHSRDFIDYIKDGANDNLKINLLKRLAPKYLANDFYYLSTGNTKTDIVSGILFTVKSLSGGATLNLLNRHSPTVASVLNENNLYTEEQIGRFFLPHNKGILIHATPSKQYIIDKDRLEPKKIYAFPDPDIVGNVYYNNPEQDNLIPLSYDIDVSQNKVTRSNQFKFGEVFSTSYNNNYYGYQSREQDLQSTSSGVCRVEDNLTFWSGLYANTWSNEDLWTVKDRDKFPNAERQQSLLVNVGLPVQYSSDIFNNDFCLIKNVSPVKTIKAELSSNSIVPGHGTKTIKNDASLLQEEKSIFNKKNNSFGTVYYRDNITNITQPAVIALSAIFSRYSKPIFNDILSGVKYFSVYGNTFVMETSGFVIVDSFDYDYMKLEIIPRVASNLFFKKATLDKKLEIFAGEWFAENTNTLYICLLRLDQNNYKSNFKALYPVIFSINLDTYQSRQIYPDPVKYSLDTYSLCGNISDSYFFPFLDIRFIEGINLEFLTTSNIFNITYLGKNLNNLPFIYNEQINQIEPYLATFTQELFQPIYYIVDNNYYSPVLSPFVQYTGATTGNVGTHQFKNGNFQNSKFDIKGINYFFCDGIKPLQLNAVGTYVVNFDWQSFNEVTVFLGCSAYTLKNTGIDIIWDYTKKTSTKLLKNQSHIINISKNNIIIDVNITRDPDDLLKFILTSSTPGFTGLFCDNLNSIYSNVSIVKTGEGNGRVISDPFCIDCNPKCSEQIGFNTTITFVASADYWSEFVNWKNDPCDGITVDCIFTVISSVELEANFRLLPTRQISVTTPAGRVYSQDLRIDAIANDGSFGPVTNTVLYPFGRYVTLSAVTPISGWVMYGYSGGGCSTAIGDRCIFPVLENTNIFARYIRYYEYPLYVNVVSLVAGESAADDHIKIGGDNVEDGVRSLDKFVSQYSCFNSCVFVMTGTNTARYQNQRATLSARPAPGRRLKYWLGDVDCSSVDITDPYALPVDDFKSVWGYSALVYPVIALSAEEPRGFTNPFSTWNNNLSEANCIYFKSPTHIELTRSQYETLANNNISWSQRIVDNSDQPYEMNYVNIGRSGLVILNKSQLTNNSKYEGYYVGLTDNARLTTIPFTGYDYVNKIASLQFSASATSPSSFYNIPESTLNFVLSAPYISPGLNISKIISDTTPLSTTMLSISGQQYRDTLTVSLFNLKQIDTQNGIPILGYNLVEKYFGSLDYYRTITINNITNSFFIGNTTDTSENFKILVNPWISNRNSVTFFGPGNTPKKSIRIASKNNFTPIITDSYKDTNFSYFTRVGVASAIDFDSMSSFVSEDDSADKLFPIGLFKTQRGIVIPDSAENVNTGTVCTLEMNKQRNVTGVFDTGFRTLTLIISGDGVGDIFSYPEEFNTLSDPPLYYFKNRSQAGDKLTYAVLQNTTLTIRCTAAKGSTFQTLSSKFCPGNNLEPIEGVSACSVIMDSDITVVAKLSAIEFYTLTIDNKATCGTLITTFPPGRFAIPISCPPNCGTTYAANRLVDIGPYGDNINCKISHFISPLLSGKGGTQYRYTGGTGITVSLMTSNAIIGDTLSLIDPSLILGPQGAPYISGPGITVEPFAYVLMTDNVTVTAVKV